MPISSSKLKRFLFFSSFILLLVLATFFYTRYFSSNTIINDPKWGMAIDSFNHVKVYYNGSVGNTNGRNKTEDGYNLGLKYQCVEFVKRYYYEFLHHKMPDSYGNAKDFFDREVKDGSLNIKRNLVQYSNPSKAKPIVNDLLIFDGSMVNSYGHVAIVCGTEDGRLTLIQQNPGSTSPSRISLDIEQEGTKWKIKNSRILGWLRKE